MKANQGHKKTQNRRRTSEEGATEEGIETSESSNDSTSRSVQLPSAFAENLPPESRESLERVLSTGREFLVETNSYIRENPTEAAGLIACAGAVLWALLGTKPGRRIVEAGSPMVSKWLADNVSTLIRPQAQIQ